MRSLSAPAPPMPPPPPMPPRPPLLSLGNPAIVVQPPPSPPPELHEDLRALLSTCSAAYLRVQEAAAESRADSLEERRAVVARVERLLALCQRATNVLLLKLERHPPSRAADAAGAQAREMVQAGTKVAAALGEQVEKEAVQRMAKAESQAGTARSGGILLNQTPGTARSGGSGEMSRRDSLSRRESLSGRGDSERQVGQLLRMANRMHDYVQSEVNSKTYDQKTLGSVMELEQALGLVESASRIYAIVRQKLVEVNTQENIFRRDQVSDAQLRVKTLIFQADALKREVERAMELARWLANTMATIMSTIWLH